MKNTGDTLLELVRSALWNEVSPLPRLQPDDWRQVMTLAKRHSVQGLVAASIMKLDGKDGMRIDEPLADLCLETKFLIAKSNQLVNSVLDKVTGLLRQAGIDFTLVKGPFVGQCYAEPLLRVPGDIDLFLTEEDAQRAADVLEPYADKDSHVSYIPRHIGLEINGVEVELHRYLIYVASDHLYDSAGLRQWTEEQRGTPIFHAIFLFQHLWQHFWIEGVGLRQFCDWAMYLHRHHQELDYDEIRRVLKRYGLLKEWQLFGLLLTKRLGLQPREFPCYSNRQWLREPSLRFLILRYGNFGRAHYTNYEQTRPRYGWQRVLHKLKFFPMEHLHLFIVDTRRSLPVIKQFYRAWWNKRKGK